MNNAAGSPPDLQVPGPLPFRLGPGALSETVMDSLRGGAVVARAEAAALALSGPGAVSCLQGLLTNDIDKPGDGAFVYGAMLTPKGLIVVDGWAGRQGGTVTYTVPAWGKHKALGIFTRSVPPRLARSRDLSGEQTVLRFAGPRSLERFEASGIAALPPPGSVLSTREGWSVARPGAAIPAPPFTLQLNAPRTEVDSISGRLRAASVSEVEPAALECVRILGGWPRLGAEIDEKTIPQEVRYDELGGVSYTKGCYTGQETVSRLHFRGHANRTLRGLTLDGEPVDGDWTVISRDRDVGRVSSLMWVPGRPPLGLAIVRREVEPGAMARVAGCDARVVNLPFPPL